MKTSSVSNLKARLSEMLRTVKSGEEVVVLEHRRPIAVIKPHTGDSLIIRAATGTYAAGPLEPLTDVDPVGPLAQERSDRW
ncbi:MAG: type II toxin-antitoxin system Phd/YefM family antitoxin [Spirochaetales bacterium]